MIKGVGDPLTACDAPTCEFHNVVLYRNKPLRVLSTLVIWFWWLLILVYAVNEALFKAKGLGVDSRKLLSARQMWWLAQAYWLSTVVICTWFTAWSQTQIREAPSSALVELFPRSSAVFFCVMQWLLKVADLLVERRIGQLQRARGDVSESVSSLLAPDNAVLAH